MSGARSASHPRHDGESIVRAVLTKAPQPLPWTMFIRLAVQRGLLPLDASESLGALEDRGEAQVSRDGIRLAGQGEGSTTADCDASRVFHLLYATFTPEQAAIWFQSPNSFLAGATPAGALAYGRYADVAAAIEGFGQGAYP